MIYKIYPIILLLFCMTFQLIGFGLSAAFHLPKWSLLAVPIPASILGFLLICLVTSRFQKIRFINEIELDGLGHTHQPLGPMLLSCITGFLAAILALLK